MLSNKFHQTKRLLNIYSNNLILSQQNLNKFSSITEYIRKLMNRIKYQDNRAIQKKDQKFTIQIKQTTKQVEQQFIADQQVKSILQKQRMKKIDQILATKTYFYQTKKYQEKIDSDHVMEIKQMKRKYNSQSRAKINQDNPQLQAKFKVKNSKKYFQNLKNLRQYPKHNSRIKDFNDQKSSQNIDFLAKQALFTKLSLKWVDTYQKSIYSEQIQNILYQIQSRRYSLSYAYFSTSFSLGCIYRIPIQKYSTSLLNSITKFTQLRDYITQIISLEQIYQILKQYYHDQRVNQWLKKVQNGQISYLLSGYQTNKEQNKIVFWVDLLGTKKQYVFMYKDLTKLTVDESGEGNKHNESKQLIVSRSMNPISQNVIFNCKPQAIFSQNSDSIYLVQRSQQGGYIQLLKVQINDDHNLGQRQIIYRCKAYQQLSIQTDKNQNYLFLRINQQNQKYSQRILILQETQNQNQIVHKLYDINPLLNSKQAQQPSNDENKQFKSREKQFYQNYRSQIDWCNKGLVIVNYKPVNDQYMKYGPTKQYSTKIELIPYKTHIQLLNESLTTSNDPLYQLPQSFIKNQRNRIPASELDFGKRQILFQCSEQQFITETSVRFSHLVISLSTKSVYNRKRIYFLPYDKSKNPHSLIFQANRINLLSFGYDYSSQIVNFSINRSLYLNQVFQYTIWKKQLIQITDKSLHIQTLKINQNVEIILTCLQRYIPHLPKYKKQSKIFQIQQQNQQQQTEYVLEKSNVPILIYLQDQKNADKIYEQKTNMHKFLSKGTIIISIQCRGNLSSDLINFYQGSGKNLHIMLNDITDAIQWIGTNLGDNISLYCKGNISSLVGTLLNIKHPFLFTSSVLHNGFYNISDSINNLFSKNKYFYQFDENVQQSLQKIFQKKYCPLKFRFKLSKLGLKRLQTQDDISQKKEEEDMSLGQDDQSSEILQPKDKPQSFPKIGSLQNIIFSSSGSIYQKSQSRSLIYYLRSNNNLKYDQVFLKQFDLHEDSQLFNLSYIYGKMKERLQNQKQ